METQSRSENTALISGVGRRLFDEPYAFEFVQAVRLLRLLSPDRIDVGFFGSPRKEIVRFGVVPSLAFPASEIFSLEEREGAPPLMRINFMGLVGPLGVLPIYYTEMVAELVRNKDTVLRDFLDVFHHRLISFFYRAWQKYRYLVGYERADGGAFSGYLLDLIGLGADGLQNRQEVPDLALLHYAGLLAQQPHSAAALEQIVADYFDVPVQVSQFLGAWYRLSEDSQCHLDDTELDSQQMGFGAIVGDEIWDPQARVRVTLGPLPLRQYLDFLPSGSAFRPLRTLIRFIGGDELDFEVQLILRREDVPACELGGSGDTAPQLGWLSWGKTEQMDRDPGETVLQL
jgi:type VI secretion system protein ImpH